MTEQDLFYFSYPVNLRLSSPIVQPILLLNESALLTQRPSLRPIPSPRTVTQTLKSISSQNHPYLATHLEECEQICPRSHKHHLSSTVFEYAFAPNRSFPRRGGNDDTFQAASSGQRNVHLKISIATHVNDCDVDNETSQRQSLRAHRQDHRHHHINQKAASSPRGSFIPRSLDVTILTVSSYQTRRSQSSRFGILPQGAIFEQLFFLAVAHIPELHLPLLIHFPPSTNTFSIQSSRQGT